MFDNITTGQALALIALAYIVILGLPALALFWGSRRTNG